MQKMAETKSFMALFFDCCRSQKPCNTSEKNRFDGFESLHCVIAKKYLIDNDVVLVIMCALFTQWLAIILGSRST